VAVSSPPVGAIALLFTDIAGSTRLATEFPAAWPELLEAHHVVLRKSIAEGGGFVAGIEGDAFFATFSDPTAAARAAVAALKALRSHTWPAGVDELKVRMGLHVGYVERSSTGYVGLEVHRAARVAAAAHGGQLLLTAAAKALVGDAVAVEPLGLHRLKDFPAPESLYCAVVDGRGAAAFPPPRTEPVRPTNLPAGVRRLIGRDVEIARVRAALLDDEERLVTLTGQGGVGKSSLALVCGESLLDEYPGGVWLARLATLTSPDEVLPAIESALPAERNLDVSPSAAIALRLRGQGKSLLILDNFEHLLSAARPVASLLEIVPELSLLITSQAPLRLAAERVIAVAGLGNAAALSLVEQVSKQRATPLDGDEQQREALSEIVSIVEGLPLALELAAASLAILNPAQLRDRLRSSTEILRDDRRDREDRHRSLRATVQWTLGALDRDQRELFARLGTFAGPVELEEIEAVAGGDGLDVISALAGLVDVALVRRIESGDDRVRFGLPEALRQTAGAMLSEGQDEARWREAHLLRQHELLWNARIYLVTEAAHQRALAADLEAAAALHWAKSTGHPLAASLAAARASMLHDTGRLREAKLLLQPLLGCPPDDPEVRGYVYLVSAWLLSLGHHDEAFDAVEMALGLLTDPHTRAAALITRGVQHAKAGRYNQAVVDHERATAIARELGATELAHALMMESQARMDDGQLELAAQQLSEAEQLGISSGARGVWPAYTIRGDLALLSGQPVKAVEYYYRSLEIAQQRGHAVQAYLDLVGLADAIAMTGRDEAALEIAGIAEAYAAEMGAERGAEWHVHGHDHIRESSSRLGPQAAERSRARGRTVATSRRVVRAGELARAATSEQENDPRPRSFSLADEDASA
jgi:predicted ATPase/class 3 adenylate cyclase